MRFQPPRGTRDYLAEEMIRREYVIETIKQVFESYGFEPMDNPAFEDFRLLAAKSGEDVKEQIFKFKDKAGRELGLRFDLTVSLARVVASNPQLPKPFKRYIIAPAWRYEEPQSGRARQFWQADIDIVGSMSMESDVECIACAVDCLQTLGFKKFLVKINNRKILDGILKIIDVEKEKRLSIIRAIDKLDKIGEEGVKKELEKIGLSDLQINKLLSIIRKSLRELKELFRGTEIGLEGIKELEEIKKYTKTYGIDKLLSLDFSLARGLDYYTGPIFEIKETVKRKTIGSLAAGGRYDNLIEICGGRPTPATGISFGIERIVEVMKFDKMFKLPKTKVKVFVANVDQKVKAEVAKITQKFRKEGVPCQADLMNRSLTKQLEYADAVNIPYVLIVGEKELRKEKFKLRDMKRKTEKGFSLKEIVKKLK